MGSPQVQTHKTVNLALQGGGAHGAFTWGALDRLLDEPRVGIENMSGTSAGAMNAAMFKTGFVDDGRDGARLRLSRFWTSVRDGARGPYGQARQIFEAMGFDVGRTVSQMFRQPIAMAQDALYRSMSPYEWNPLNINPLRALLDAMINWDNVCRSCYPHIFVCATNVRSGRIRVFNDQDLSTDVILASACLPFLFQAVEIKGEAYWDGGYMGNPALFPLFESYSRDIIIIHVNPIEREEVPKSAREIMNRINEISFNSSLLRELRAIDFVRRLIEDDRLSPREYADVNIHSIRDDATMRGLDSASKISPDGGLIDTLFDTGRAAADKFLREHWSTVGEDSTVDLRAMFQGTQGEDGGPDGQAEASKASR